MKEVDDGIWLVSFMDDLGYVDLEERTLQPLTQSVWSKTDVTHVSDCYLCIRAGPKPSGGGGGI